MSAQMGVLPGSGGKTELLDCAGAVTAADLSITREGHRGAQFDVVSVGDGERGRGPGHLNPDNA